MRHGSVGMVTIFCELSENVKISVKELPCIFPVYTSLLSGIVSPAFMVVLCSVVVAPDDCCDAGLPGPAFDHTKAPFIIICVILLADGDHETFILVMVILEAPVFWSGMFRNSADDAPAITAPLTSANSTSACFALGSRSRLVR